MHNFTLTLLLSLCVFNATAQYCDATYTAGTTDNDYIDGFELNTINNLASGPGDGSGYSDFTDLSTILYLGETYTMHIVNTPSFAEGYRAWIDYNQNEVFASDEEIMTAVSLTAGDETFIDFTIPLSASIGDTRLRVRCVYGTTSFTSCSSQTYGEAEDYTILIAGLGQDIGVVDIAAIAPDCDLSATSPITITIENFGTESALGFNLNFAVDGGAIITEPFIGGIIADATITYTFIGTADLSVDGYHNIVAWSSWISDEFTANDSLSAIAENTSTFLTAGFSESICYDGGTLFPSPIAGGGTWSGDAIINSETGELNPALVGGIGASTIVNYSFIPTDAYTVTAIPFAPYNLYDPASIELGDDAFATAAIGFNFTFFGITYTSLSIASNGFVQFLGGTFPTSYSPQHFPNATQPNNMIAFCWTDLNPGDGGNIYYEMQGTAPYRRFIIEYNEVKHYLSDATVTGQIVIYETSNMIDIINNDIESDGGNMTQGIEDLSGTTAYVADELYNLEAFSMENLAWRYAVTPCAGTVTDTIYFITPPDLSIDDATVCAGEDVVLDAGDGAESYFWSTGETTQTINIVESGDYWVVYVASLACSVGDSAHIVINPLPVIELGDDGIACEGTMLDAENIGASYSWNTGAITQTLFVTETGTYNVEVIDANGCSNLDTISMIITPLPIAAFDVLVTDALTAVFTSLAVDAITWFWDFGDGTTSTIENPWHTYPIAGSYNVTLVVTNDCGADLSTSVIEASTAVVTINRNEINIYPNPSTDYFSITVPAQLQQNNAFIQLYNMLGDVVADKQINGATTIMFNTINLPSGSYIVSIKSDDLILNSLIVIE